MNPPAGAQTTSPSPISRPESKWTALLADLREAVRGTSRTSLKEALAPIVLLSVPTILEMSMESLFGIVDVFGWPA